MTYALPSAATIPEQAPLEVGEVHVMYVLCCAFLQDSAHGLCMCSAVHSYKTVHMGAAPASA